MPKVFWYQVSLSYGTGGIAVDEGGRIHEAAPIFRWMIGRNLTYITPWVMARDGWIRAVPEGGEE